jgi:hypothetical protein
MWFKYMGEYILSELPDNLIDSDEIVVSGEYDKLFKVAK